MENDILTDNVTEEDNVISIKRKRMMKYFVNAAKEIIEFGGIEDVTIRNVAQKAGYNSATIYNYFRDLDQLILFGTVGYLRNYIVELTDAIKPEMNALERYRTIYCCFNKNACRYPKIFFHMFFGQRSNELAEVLSIYYGQLFPEELENVKPLVKKMMLHGTMQERDSEAMQELVDEGFIDKTKSKITLDLIIAVHESFLYEACRKETDVQMQEHRESFCKLFNYLLEQGKPEKDKY